MFYAITKKCCLLTLLLIVAPSAYAQTQQQNASPEPIKLSTELVVLDIEVIARKTGRAVAALRKEDFSVYEDSVRQEIVHISQNSLPLSIVLLLDLSGTTQPIIPQIRSGALQALQRLKPEDEVAVMAFAQRTQLVQGFSKDRELIVSKIENIKETADVGGVTFLNEAIYQAATHLYKASNPSNRRVIIAITDNHSNQTPRHGHSEKEALYELLESGSSVCGVIVLSGLAKVDKILRYNPAFILISKVLSFGSIKTYADKTGGIVVGAKKEEIATRFVAMIERLRTRYAIGYIPSNTKLDGRFRKIKLRLSPAIENREGKLAILTRQGYYARRSNQSRSEITK
jgi:VWFA-related protein